MLKNPDFEQDDFINLVYIITPNHYVGRKYNDVMLK